MSETTSTPSPPPPLCAVIQDASLGSRVLRERESATVHMHTYGVPASSPPVLASALGLAIIAFSSQDLLSIRHSQDKEAAPWFSGLTIIQSSAPLT